MATILYTDTDQIRSVIGVDESDVSDKSLIDRNLDKELRLDLISWLPTHAALYAAGAATDASEASRSISDSITLYCTYYCAVQAANSLRMSAPQQVSDGKNSLTRFQTIDWNQIIKELSSRAAYYKGIISDLTAQTLSVTSITLFAGVGLAVDPVTSTQ